MSINTVSLRASSIPVKSATIFQSSAAELTRRVTIELKCGHNLLEISGLSSKLDTESPRLSGAPDDEPSTGIKVLKAQRRALQEEQEVRREEIKLLKDTAQLVTNGDYNHNSDHDKLLAFMDKYVQRKRCIQKAIQNLDEEIGEIDKKIYAHTRSSCWHRVRPRSEVHTASITADAVLQPAPTSSTVIPLPPESYVPIAGSLAYFSFSAQPAQAERHPRSLALAPTAPPPMPLSLVNRNALSVVYRVQGTVSLSSNGEEHRLTIVTLDFKAKLKYMCVPRRSPTVYIIAKVKNTSEFDLLSGPANVFMNDSYVTKTVIPFITTTESFSCVLGVDSSLKVSYVPNERTEYEPKRNFAEPQKTTTKALRVMVANLHKFDIGKLVIWEAICWNKLERRQARDVPGCREPASQTREVLGFEKYGI
ncbi:hypothetical protein GY45DRAFT_1376088 [Cubamyces sp. BRFM 1775]|nr:hypothetical protein GY45DRAFT_1376088 [Cubamyces sp. BRFM 1775]